MLFVDEFDFNDGEGPVNAHRHPKGGGWVADTAKVDETCFVGENACVYGEAIVRDKASIRDNARVFDKARVFDNAKIYGHAAVFGNSVVRYDSRVSGYATVHGHAELHDFSKVYDDAEVYGNAVMRQYSEAYHNAKVYGTAQLDQYCKIYDTCVATKKPIIVHGFEYQITFTDHHMSIGCISLPISVWKEKGEEILVQFKLFNDGEAKIIIRNLIHIARFHGTTDREEDIEESKFVLDQIKDHYTLDRIAALRKIRNEKNRYTWSIQSS
jgi:carbonic anhydrase/acetyltransferase-like protein (isoleucine patch superfamily)